MGKIFNFFLKFLKSLTNRKDPEPEPDPVGQLIMDPPDPDPQHCFQEFKLLKDQLVFYLR